MIVPKRTALSMSGMLLIHPAASWMKIAEGTPGILKDTAADTGNRQEAHMCKINLSLLSLLRALY